MANEVVAKPVFGGKVAVADVRSLAQKAAESAQNNPRGGAPNGSDYMNFSGKRGVYTIGQQNRVIGTDELWVVDVSSFEEGWVAWKGGKPASTRLANIYNGVPVMAPDPQELGPFNTDKGEGWFQAKAMVLKSFDHDQQGYFKINSVSGVSAMAELIGAFAERAAAGEPCWPVLVLDKEEFEAQGFKNYKPVFDVKVWLSQEQMQQIADGESIYDVAPELDAEDEPAPPPPPARNRRTLRP